MTDKADICWFSPNEYCSMVVPYLKEKGLDIQMEGEVNARITLAMSSSVARNAWIHSKLHKTKLILHIWDLPHWRLGNGLSDHIIPLRHRLLRIPRLFRYYKENRRFYSELYYIIRRASMVLVPSASTAESVLAQYGIRAKEIHYCYDSNRFHIDEEGTSCDNNPPVLLTVSRLVAYKNQGAVIRVAARFTPSLQVCIIGKGPERERLENLAQQSGVKCVIHSDVPDAQMPVFYRNADVLVCPSRFEGFGVTPLEGLACGKPAVVSDIPPHCQFIGEMGFHFDPDNEETLYWAIVQALEHKKPRSTDRLRTFTIEAAGERYFELLSQLIATP